MPNGRNALRADTTTPQPRPVGRPTDYNLDIAGKLCARLALGESLKRVTMDEAMPDRSTVYVWLAKHTEFADMYARAKEDSADVDADEIKEIADNVDEDPNSRRIRVDARKWIAAKLKPRKYGDQIDVNHRHTLDQLLAEVPNKPDPLLSTKPAIEGTATEITSNAVLADSKQSGG